MDIFIDLIQTQVNNMLGKYSKITLQKLEDQGVLTPELRKIVLDGFNDCKRDLARRFLDIKSRYLTR